MKYFWICLLLICSNSKAQTFSVKGNAGEDLTNILQQAYNTPNVNTILINHEDVILSGTLNIPDGKVLKFEGGYRIKGNGTINGGIIEANYHQQIFDTTLTVNPKAVNQYFSVNWFGATGNNSTDDYNAIQKSINTCIKNNIRVVYLPIGKYHISRPLILRGASDNDQRRFCTLEMLGESSFWDSNSGTQLYTDFTNAFAIGIQDGKGCKIKKLRLTGKFVPPFSNDMKKFFRTTFEEFTDHVCRDSRYSPYAGIVIDPFTNLSGELPLDGGYPELRSYYGKANGLATQSGSTATELEELNINNFVVGICSSPNGLTRNAEITLINKVQFENCKLCISGGQDQEKANVVSNIHCWGGTHTIFATGLYGVPRMAGNWNIDHGNIAGAVVRFIYNDGHGYFPTYISHIYAESLGTWGTINSELACEISDCHIDFAYPDVAGKQTLITSYGENIVYRSCNFRYYGYNTPLITEGNCIFEHCYFSGRIKNTSDIFSRSLIAYNKGKIIQGGIILFAMAVLLFICVYFYRHTTNKGLY